MAEQQSFITAVFICELWGVCLQGTEMGQAKDLLMLELFFYLVMCQLLVPRLVETEGEWTRTV